MQLNTKILLFVIPLIVIPIAGVGWLAYDRLSYTSEQAGLREVDTLVTQSGQQVQAYLRTLRANLGLFADSRILKSYILASEEDRYELLQAPLFRQLAANNRAFPEYYEMRVLLADGYEDARYTGERLVNITDEEGQNPVFQAMHQSADDVFIQLFKNPDTQSWALWASQRLMLVDASSTGLDAQKPSLRGYLVLTVDLGLLEEQAQNRVGRRGAMFFTNSDGQVLFHPHSSRIATQLSPDIMGRVSGQPDFSFTEGEFLFAGRQLDAGLLLYTQLPLAEIHEAGTRLGWMLLAITLVVTLATIALLLWVLRRLIIGPIHQLADAAREIGEGKLHCVLDIDRKDEIGFLASRFHTMAEDLKTSLEQKERAQAEALQHREQAIANLKEMDRLKDEFLANTSHELRTPLNGIIGLADSLMDGVAGPLNKEVKKNLLMIMSSGQRLTNLVNDILDFSKLKHKTLNLQYKAVELSGLVGMVLASSRPLAANKPLKVINSIDAKLPAALADENRLQQILYNVIGNAVKFTREGEVEISARLEEGVSPTPSPQGADPSLLVSGQRLLVSIRDTGVGISASAKDSIFRSFEQGDGSTAREFGGTGLGLAVTRQLVELQGGEIWFESQPGQGSTFYFSLAVSSIKAEVAQLPKVAQIEDTEEDEEVLDELTQTALIYAREARVFKIMIVDDEPVNLQVLENYLAHLNYHVERASNGMEALDKIRSGYHPDLILLDIMMPKVSGFEVCRKLRETLPASELPILMLTAKNQPQDIVEGFSVGANDYLTKPVSKGELLARVKTHIYLHNVNVALSRFVPHQFLQLLEKESILEVELGDQVAREMTVLFSDIRDFTSLSERMTPQETYNFLNKYLSRMEPVITRHHGFIDKYIGDAIMALYPTGANEAVSGAVEMLMELHRFNDQRAHQALPPIHIGIGLNTGQLMLGTVGGANRMDGTVISDAVNLASRIEGLTKVYGVPLLISEHTLNALSSDHGHLVRELDTVRVRGKSIPITVYEIFDADREQLREHKIRTLPLFEAGISHFKQGEIFLALQCFRQVAEQNPQDPAAAIYLARCEQNAD